MMRSPFRHALKKSFHVGMAIAKLNERCDSCVSDCVHRETINKLIKLLWGLDIGNEPERNLSGDGSTRDDAAFLDEFFRSRERRENDAFDEGTSRVFSKWLACFVMVEFNEVFHCVL